MFTRVKLIHGTLPSLFHGIITVLIPEFDPETILKHKLPQSECEVL